MVPGVRVSVPCCKETRGTHQPRAAQTRAAATRCTAPRVPRAAQPARHTPTPRGTAPGGTAQPPAQPSPVPAQPSPAPAQPHTARPRADSVQGHSECNQYPGDPSPRRDRLGAPFLEPHTRRSTCAHRCRRSKCGGAAWVSGEPGRLACCGSTQAFPRTLGHDDVCPNPSHPRPRQELEARLAPSVSSSAQRTTSSTSPTCSSSSAKKCPGRGWLSLEGVRPQACPGLPRLA